MIFRFSLYGFLKNLRLFEAFVILAFRERGFDYLQIGALIAAREIAVNLCEVPSGLIADWLGRRRCMVASMTAYVVCYLVLGLSTSFAACLLAMILFGCGDAFRSGTHKAMIYAWLRQQDRSHDKTAVYGYTRSWSKIGSALSALLAGALVFYSGSYVAIFLWSALPAALNVLNLATYPRALDRDPDRPPAASMRAELAQLFHASRQTLGKRDLRRLVGDTVAMEGGYGVVKDYLQPVVQQLAIATIVVGSLEVEQRVAVIGGLAYAGVFALAAFGSRRASSFEKRFADTATGVRALQGLALTAYLTLLLALLQDWAVIAVLVFLALGLLQNVWRPIHVGRFDRPGEESHAATVLSIEAQAKSITVAVGAPLIGWLVDLGSASQQPVSLPQLWPVTLVALPLLWQLAGRLPKKENSEKRS